MSTILLVEDDPDILHMIALKLRREGFEVREAADGVAALAAARLEPPDLALVDVRMPRMDGLAVCRELRDAPRTREIPIIVLTAGIRPHDREQAFEAGATDFVVKPFSPRELVRRIETTLSGVTVR